MAVSWLRSLRSWELGFVERESREGCARKTIDKGGMIWRSVGIDLG